LTTPDITSKEHFDAENLLFDAIICVIRPFSSFLAPVRLFRYRMVPKSRELGQQDVLLSQISGYSGTNVQDFY